MSTQVVVVDPWRGTGGAYGDFGEPRTVKWQEESVATSTQIPASGATIANEVEQPTQTNALSVEELYPYLGEFSTLSTAFNLLDEASSHLQIALDAIQQGQTIAADDEVQQTQALLPELFCCRSLGDGLGTIINSLRIALKNQEGSPLNLQQLRAVARSIKRVRQLPFLTFEEALDSVIEMEDAGLLVDPVALSELANLGE